MKIYVAARVVGHKLFQPNPKDAPEIEVAKVSLVIASMSQHTTKATAATVHVDVDATNDEFALGRTIRLTFEDWQQELALGDKKPPLVVDGERFDPETGESLGADYPVSVQFGNSPAIHTTADGMRRAIKAVKAGKAAKAGRGVAN